MLPHPVTIQEFAPELCIILFITCMIGWSLWVWDTNKAAFKIAELEEEQKKLAETCKARILERNETARLLEASEKEHSRAIKNGLELGMQLNTAREMNLKVLGKLEASENQADKWHKEKCTATALLLEACKAAQEIDKLRLNLCTTWKGAEDNTVRPQHTKLDPEKTDGPTPGPVVPYPTIPAVPAYAQATIGDRITSGDRPLQGISAPARRYDQGLKTDRTA